MLRARRTRSLMSRAPVADVVNRDAHFEQGLELRPVATEERGLDEVEQVHHLHEVVLDGRAGQDQSPLGRDMREALVDDRVGVLHLVSLVEDGRVRRDLPEGTDVFGPPYLGVRR